MPNEIIPNRKELNWMKNNIQNKDKKYIITPPILGLGVLWKACGLLKSLSKNVKTKLWFFMVINDSIIVKIDNKKILYKDINSNLNIDYYL